MDAGLSLLTEKNILQPVLFRAESTYYVKLDNTAVALGDCSCFTDAVEFLFMSFFVFNVDYPQELRIFSAFLEHVMQVKGSVKSTVLADFIRALGKVNAV